MCLNPDVVSCTKKVAAVLTAQSGPISPEPCDPAEPDEINFDAFIGDCYYAGEGRPYICDRDLKAYSDRSFYVRSEADGECKPSDAPKPAAPISKRNLEMQRNESMLQSLVFGEPALFFIFSVLYNVDEIRSDGISREDFALAPQSDLNPRPRPGDEKVLDRVIDAYGKGLHVFLGMFLRLSY